MDCFRFFGAEDVGVGDLSRSSDFASAAAPLFLFPGIYSRKKINCLL